MTTIQKMTDATRAVFQILVCILTFNFLSPPGVRAAFEPVAVGARPAGLGGAYTALCDDVYGVYYNPAGLAFLQRSEFSAQYSQMYVGLWDKSSLGYSFAGIAQPLKFKKDYGTIGFSWLSFAAGSLYKENSMALSYGKIFASKTGRIFSAGINLKSLSLGYGLDPDGYSANAVDSDGNATGSADTLFQKFGMNKSAYSIDLGLQFRPFKNYRAGMAITNLNEPGISLNPSDPVKLSRAVSLGVAHTGKNFSIAVDYLTRQINQVSDYRLSLAGEQTLPAGIGLRAGLVTGARELTNLAAGVGFKTSSFQFDYALEYPLSGIKGTMGNHKVSLILRFGPVIRADDASFGVLKQELEQTKEKLDSANAEINKLNVQLEQILKKPAPMPAVPEIAPAVLQSVVSQQPESETAAAQIRKEYKSEYASYIRDAKDLIFVKRIDRIRAIADKYRGKTEITEADQEHKILLQEQKTQTKMYFDSMSYYDKMSLRGIDNKTSKDILKRIIEKYSPFGVDVSRAKEEMNRLP